MDEYIPATERGFPDTAQTELARMIDTVAKLGRENHALRDAGGLMRAWIGNNEKTITERWDSVLANVAVTDAALPDPQSQTRQHRRSV